jgi:hypothetical protein
MARRATEKRKPGLAKTGEGAVTLAVSPEEKIARLLGLLVVRDIDTSAEKVKLLRNIGFSISEVALMLDVSENAVADASHRARNNSA